jgi:protein-tyrosine phosphatase
LEWTQRTRLNNAQFARLQNPETIRRNRYGNVDPYDKNRIHLKVPEGHSDYINASPVEIPRSKNGTPKPFIATQGPKADSFGHFWRMVLEQSNTIAVIIMLTQTHEMGKEKCHQYFPLDMENPTMTFNETDEFGDGLSGTVTLKSVREDAPTRTTIRELELSASNGTSIVVYHLLFGGWPDFSIPEGSDRTALVNLIHYSRELVAKDPQNPRFVHCSAGVGRTGTFIALDWLLSEIENDEGVLEDMKDDDDPVAFVVDQLREQRMMMVQGEQQFSFIYDVVREAWIKRWKSRNRKL